MPLHSFKRGDIVWWKFTPSEIRPDYTIRGWHMAVILSEPSLHNRTIVVSPISSHVIDKQSSNPQYKRLKDFHLALPRSAYPHFLQHDSFVKLDQLYTLSRDAIHRKIVGSLSASDMLQVDMKLLRVLKLFETVDKLLDIMQQSSDPAPNPPLKT